jgi:hypothetical protein
MDNKIKKWKRASISLVIKEIQIKITEIPLHIHEDGYNKNWLASACDNEM